MQREHTGENHKGSPSGIFLRRGLHFQGDSLPAHMVLINGLMRDNIEVARVVDVEFPKREDTTQIPIVGFEDK